MPSFLPSRKPLNTIQMAGTSTQIAEALIAEAEAERQQQEEQVMEVRNLPENIQMHLSTITKLRSRLPKELLTVTQTYQLERIDKELQEINALLNRYQQLSDDDDFPEDVEIILQLTVEELTALIREVQTELKDKLQAQRIFMFDRNSSL